MTRLVRGTALSPGIGYGRTFYWAAHVVAVPIGVEPDQVQAEIQRFRQAVQQAKRELKEMREKVARILGVYKAHILDAQIHMLRDRAILEGVETRIRDQRVNAEWALELVIRDYYHRFQAIEDAYLRERWQDVQDALRRVQRALMGTRPPLTLPETESLVLVAEELTPSDFVELVGAIRVRGLVLEQASAASHVAILARSLRIPAVSGIQRVFETVPSGHKVLIDGYEGNVIVDPTPLQVQEYRSKRKYFIEHIRLLQQEATEVAQTPDGFRVHLLANIEFADEWEQAIEYGAEGIGLFRSEYLYFMYPDRLPSEEEHYRVYRDLVTHLHPRPVVIRTADLGAEKLPQWMQERLPRDSNPLIGLRAIRLGLKRREIWEPQIAAMLRAAVHGDLRILVPFVSTIEEVLEFLDMVEDVRHRLRKSGVEFEANPPIGVMIEIPAMAYMVRHLHEFVQFVSIGTNDLIQFMLAVARDHEGLRYLYKPYHPAVLRLIYTVVQDAQDVGLEVNICGEMASDILSIPLLVGMGCPQLSMTPQWIPAIRFFIQEVHRADGEQLLEQALQMRMGTEVEEMLLEWIQSRFPEGIYHPLIRKLNRTDVTSRLAVTNGSGS